MKSQENLDKKEFKHFYKKALKLYKDVIYYEYKEKTKKGAV